ncbi:Ternary complex factor MIP1, leucine-zipper [Dillenia turbinata]|uniref:Ternary complex factor MIP1, leucine-zipper n=1 Tax=Dillenia turbinata TaxID=194707 RepID=A0AAN8YWU0_9MAGN
MCDSTALLPSLIFGDLTCTKGDSFSKCTISASECCTSESHVGHMDGVEVSGTTEETASSGSCKCDVSSGSHPYRSQLEQDVRKLQQQLQEEMELHVILENAMEKTAVKLSSISWLPDHAQELLSSIALLEASVSELEKQMVSLHFQLSQERNERRLAEYHLKHSSSEPPSPCSPDITKSPISSSLRCLKHSLSELRTSSGNLLCKELRDHSSVVASEPSTAKFAAKGTKDFDVLIEEKSVSAKAEVKSQKSSELGKLVKDMPPKGLWDYPNQLSEEMVRCMKNIFISLGDSSMPSKLSSLESHCSSLSPRGHLSNSSLWSLSERSLVSSEVQSPQVDLQNYNEVLALENACDLYRVRGKLSWSDIGSYGLAVEVSCMSVGKKQLEYAAGALRRFRLIWLMESQKAAYTVGRHSFSAAAIEFVILKMRPPVHRPQIALLLALHKIKMPEEQKKFALSTYEPLVTFALSSGMYSSPAVRIYTAKNVREELEEAQLDFIRASVGVSSKGKLLVPKMLHCFARSVVDDSKLAVWISHYLPACQAAFVEKCMSQRRQKLLGSRNCGILPFDSRFRYLFLPEKISR